MVVEQHIVEEESSRGASVGQSRGERNDVDEQYVTKRSWMTIGDAKVAVEGETKASTGKPVPAADTNGQTMAMIMVQEFMEEGAEGSSAMAKRATTPAIKAAGTATSFVQTMLSATPLAVLSRLSYGIYLIHFPFFLLWKSAVRERLYTNIFNLFSESVPVFVWSCMLALVLFLACEAPVGRLDKILWAKSSLKKKEEQVNEGHDLELPTRHSEAPEETHHR
ncbi:hypothetical protein HPB51_018515 [Rhipicephalus microplus]|uniref:Acyltransferase n=1 Tax=Rhipicephalus microplus TaxID=6941 RepID=A0A9J6EIR2_RHIMP|nr:hypothetical protein HPB51_018515 [Rhipicephalus microplus]